MDMLPTVEVISTELRNAAPFEMHFPAMYRTYAYAMRRCSIQERRFVRALVEHNGNAYEAAESIGLRKFMGDRLLARESVQRAWRAQDAIGVHGLGINNFFLLQRMSWLAKSDIGKVMNADGSIKGPEEWPEGVSVCVESLEVDELWYGKGESRKQIGVSKKIKMRSPDKMLLQLAKMRGLIREKPVETPADEGQQPRPQMSDAELARRLIHVLTSVDRDQQKQFLENPAPAGRR